MTALACAGLQVYLIPVRLPSTNICAGVKSEMGTRLGVGKRQICFLRPRHQLTFAKGFLSNWHGMLRLISMCSSLSLRGCAQLHQGCWEGDLEMGVLAEGRSEELASARGGVTAGRTRRAGGLGAHS